MTSRPLRLGFVGGGLRSAIGLTHRLASQLDGRWTLEAGCFSHDANRNRETAERWGVSPDRCHPTWERLFEEEQGRLDAVAILTPTPNHFPMVMGALAAGIPVICEKALAPSAVEAERLAEAVVDQRGFLAVTYNYTGYPMLRELRALCLSGRLGSLGQLVVEMPQEGFARPGSDGSDPRPQMWRRHDGPIPTVHLDLGVHVHQLVGFLTGQEPTEVVADHATVGRVADVVDTAAALARCDGGLRCQFWFGKAALGHRNGLRVRAYGTLGSAEWYQMEPEHLWVSDDRGRRERLERGASGLLVADDPRYSRFKAGHPGGFIEAFANHYGDIADGLLAFRRTGASDSPWVFGARTALSGLRFLEAMADSFRTNGWRNVAGDSSGSR